MFPCHFSSAPFFYDGSRPFFLSDTAKKCKYLVFLSYIAIFFKPIAIILNVFLAVNVVRFL